MLTDAIAPDPRAHIAENAKALVARAFGHDSRLRRLRPATPATSRRRAPQSGRACRTREDGAPIVGIQPAAGRRIKEWDPARFAEVGAELARTRGASVVLIGSAGDKPVLDAVRAAWPSDVPLDRASARYRSRRARRGARAADAVHHRRYRADASGRRGRHAGARDFRAVAANALRAAVSAFENRAHRHPLQPVQPDAAAAGALSRPCSRLPRRHRFCRRAPRRKRNAGRIMTSRPAIGIAVVSRRSRRSCPRCRRLSKGFHLRQDLVRSVFSQAGLRRCADRCAHVRNQSEVPRRADRRCPARISARAGADSSSCSQPQTIEFFAGGNDEVELRVDGAAAAQAEPGRRDEDHRPPGRVSTPARTNSPSTFSSSAAAWR